MSASLDPRLTSEVRRIELRSRRAIDADLIGRYRSAFRGSGLLFRDLREYQPGDDIKHIHWRATARSEKVYVKSYEEDRHLTVMLLLDISRSTLFGAGKNKHDQAVEFSALIALLGQMNQDQVGVCLFADGVEEYIAPGKSRAQFQRVLLALLSHRELKPRTDLRGALDHVLRNQKRPAVIFLISDFLAGGYEDLLARVAVKHDLICTLVEDPLDASLPRAGLVEFVDAERGTRSILDTSSRRVQEALRRHQELRIQKLRDLCMNSGADLMRLAHNPVRALAQLMQQRSARVR